MVCLGFNELGFFNAIFYQTSGSEIYSIFWVPGWLVKYLYSHYSCPKTQQSGLRLLMESMERGKH